MRLVHHYLIESAQRYPDKIALICDKKPWSYTELVRRVYLLSAALVDVGLQKGDRALVLLSDKSEFLAACYAVMKGGGIAVPLPEGDALPSVEEIAHNCTPSILITSRRNLARFPLLRDKLGCKFLIVEDPNAADDSDSMGGYTRAMANMVLFGANKMSGAEDRGEPIGLVEDDGATLLFASGAAGKKKGVLLSHRNLVKATLNINGFVGIDSSIREFVGIPLTNSSGFGRTCCVHFVGGTMVVNNGLLNPIALIESVLKHQCDAISAMPSGLALFFGRLEALLQRIGPQIRFIELGSAFMPLDHKMRLLDIFPNARICMHYGLAEASRSTFLDFGKERRKLHTVGRALPSVSLRIIDDLGRRVGHLETGEVLLKGDHVAARYWDDVELDRQCYTSDGWFKTGDYGFVDEEGYLHLLGRKDEMINMVDLKISPVEVEERIHELYPDCEICVVGIPDPAGIVGEIPVLCYTAKNGITITPSDLSHGLASRLDRSKIPRVVYRVESIPRTEDEKIMRRELRRRIFIGSTQEMEEVH